MIESHFNSAGYRGEAPQIPHTVIRQSRISDLISVSLDSVFADTI